jgi:hypothetical protein
VPEEVNADFTYRERVYPRMGTFFVVVLFIAMISIAYGAAINMYTGLAIFTIGIIGMFFGLWFSSPVIAIIGKQGTKFLTVAQAAIPLELISHPRILNADELVAIRRGQIGITAFVTIRGNLPSVAVTVTDPDDPHQLWVVSSRRSKVLCECLESAPFDAS